MEYIIDNINRIIIQGSELENAKQRNKDLKIQKPIMNQNVINNENNIKLMGTSELKYVIDNKNNIIIQSSESKNTRQKDKDLKN